MNETFKILTWSSRRRGWDQRWYCRLWLKWREPCTGYCCQHNLKKMGRQINIIFMSFILFYHLEIITSQVRLKSVKLEAMNGWWQSFVHCYQLQHLSNFHWQGQAPFPLPPSNPSLHTPSLSQRVIDHIPFLNPTDQLSHWHRYRNPRGLKQLWGSSLSAVLLPIRHTQTADEHRGILQCVHRN